jgi:hypothetical protein
VDGGGEELVLPESLLTLIGPQRIGAVAKQGGPKLTELPLSFGRYRVTHDKQGSRRP